MDVAQIVSKFGKPSPGWWVIAILAVLSLIQISPVKINPWDAILGWLGRKLNGKELSLLQGEMTDLKAKVNGMWVSAHRHAILTFARECRSGIEHDAEEWNHILNLCGEYEEYCSKREVMNGVVRENTKYIRNLFHELSRERKL